jgi:hypothetical protein
VSRTLCICISGSTYCFISSSDPKSHVLYCHHFASVVLIVCELYHFNLYFLQTNGPIVTWVVLNSLHDFHFNLKVNMATIINYAFWCFEFKIFFSPKLHLWWNCSLIRMFLTEKFFFVNQKSKMAAIAKQSFNIIGKWKIIFSETYQFFLTQTIHEWSLDGPLHNSYFICQLEIQDGHLHSENLT